MEGKADARTAATDPVVTHERLSALRAEHLRRPGRRSVTAISVQTAALIWAELERLPDNGVAIELGMGFSTWVMRTFQAERPGIVVHSYDGDSRWRDATVRELCDLGLPCEPNGMLADWRQLPDNCADLVFVDHGKAYGRVADLPRVVRQLRPGGVIVLDDWQFTDAALAMGASLRELGLYVTPREDLIDSHGRFPAVARQR